MASTQSFRSLMIWALLFILAVEQSAAAEGVGYKTILVSKTGWHSGIIIARGDLSEGAIPETAGFPYAVYFEFGWGSAKYYPLRHKTIRMMIGGVVPGPAVIHLVGLRRHPSELFPDHERPPGRGPDNPTSRARPLRFFSTPARKRRLAYRTPNTYFQ